MDQVKIYFLSFQVSAFSVQSWKWSFGSGFSLKSVEVNYGQMLDYGDLEDIKSGFLHLGSIDHILNNKVFIVWISELISLEFNCSLCDEYM